MTRDLFERIAVKNYYLSAAGLYYAKVTQLIDLAADDDTCRAEAVCYLLMSYEDSACFKSAAFFDELTTA